MRGRLHHGHILRTALLALAVSAAVGACTRAHDCRPGTLFLHVDFSPFTGVQRVAVEVTVAGETTRAMTFDVQPPGADSGGVQVNFDTYPAGKHADVVVRLEGASGTLASRTVGVDSAGECLATDVSFGAPDGGAGGRGGAAARARRPAVRQRWRGRSIGQRRRYGGSWRRRGHGRRGAGGRGGGAAGAGGGTAGAGGGAGTGVAGAGGRGGVGRQHRRRGRGLAAAAAAAAPASRAASGPRRQRRMRGDRRELLQLPRRRLRREHRLHGHRLQHRRVVRRAGSGTGTAGRHPAGPADALPAELHHRDDHQPRPDARAVLIELRLRATGDELRGPDSTITRPPRVHGRCERADGEGRLPRRSPA